MVWPGGASSVEKGEKKFIKRVIIKKKIMLFFFVVISIIIVYVPTCTARGTCFLQNSSRGVGIAQRACVGKILLNLFGWVQFHALKLKIW